jgi:hypothetical protein
VLALLLAACPLTASLLPDAAAAFPFPVRDGGGLVVAEIRPAERWTRISAVDTLTLEVTRIFEGRFLMAPVGLSIAGDGDLLISRSTDGAIDSERIHPVPPDLAVPGFDLRELHRLDLFVIAVRPGESGAFTTHLPDGDTALFIDERLLRHSRGVGPALDGLPLVSEIDNGWTLRIPLGVRGVSTFVVENLFEGAEEATTLVAPGVPAPEGGEPILFPGP